MNEWTFQQENQLAGMRNFVWVMNVLGNGREGDERGEII